MDLSHAQMSSPDGPARIAVHAPGGYGKTTIAAHFPNPIIIGAEKGVPRDLGFEVATIHPRDWLEVFDVIGALTRDKHPHFTAVLDTVDWLEPFIHQFVCARDSGRKTEMNPKSNELISIEDYGYGKGYLVAEEEFRKLIRVLDILQNERGMHIVMLAHSQTKTFKNPSGPDFDRWEPKCHYRIAKVVEEWAENMLFGFFQIDAAKISEDKERNKSAPERARAKGVGGGTRMVGAQHSAMYDAKNRVGLPAEFELGLEIDGMIAALIGEDVAMAPRRAAVREVKREEAWVDRQRRLDGDRAQAAARDNADDHAPREASPPPADRAPAQDDRRPTSEDDRRRDSRTWTEPSRDQRPPQDTRAPANANGDARAHVERTLDSGKLTARLGEARRQASNKSQAYLDRVNGWVEKAGDDPHRITSIIAQVEKDLGVSIPNA